VGVIYPSSVKFTSSIDHALLKLGRGATSCQVGQGSWQNANANAIFVVENTTIRVAIRQDPVFGVKTTKHGSLIQVKRGTVRVASTGRAAPPKAVRHDQQVLVPSGGSSLGAVKALKLDPALRSGLCALTPTLSLTNVTAASGAHPGGDPLGLAPDPKGNIWFTDDATPGIGVYNPTDGKIAYPANGDLNQGSVPRFIAADAAGNIWFTDTGPIPAIGKIDARASSITELRLPSGSVPWSPAYDPIHNLVWFTDQRKPNGAIGVIDPTTNTIAEYSKGLRPGSHPEGIVVDARGNAWFTDDNDPSPAVGMIDATTHEIHEYSRGLVPGSLPRGINVGLDGNIWFADERTVDNRKADAPGDGLIGKISSTNPTRGIGEYAIEANGGNKHSIPEGLAWYHGYVWFTDDGATKAIGRIDPSTGAVTESSKELVANSKPIGILVTKGVLWFSDRLKDSPRIGRLVTKTSC
jgi:streptogramin lyase